MVSCWGINDRIPFNLSPIAKRISSSETGDSSGNCGKVWQNERIKEYVSLWNTILWSVLLMSLGAMVNDSYDEKVFKLNNRMGNPV